MTNVAAFVPTIRPLMLEKLLKSWRKSEYTDGIALYVHAQREPQGDFTSLYGPEVTGATYSSRGGPILPMRVAGMLAHPEVDVWVHLDDDMEILPELTNWWPGILKAIQPGVGVVSCNWARSEAFIKHRWPPKNPIWLRQVIVNMSGGQIYHRRIATLLSKLGSPGPVTPYLFDDIQPGITAYINGYENFRYRGSLLIHRIGSPNGQKTLLSVKPWPLPDAALVKVRESKGGWTDFGNISENQIRMPVEADVLPEAHRLHNLNRAILMEENHG